MPAKWWRPTSFYNWPYGASPWAECHCPLCGAKPTQFCVNPPWLVKRFPRLRPYLPTPMLRFDDHPARTVMYQMKYKLDD